MSKKYLITFLTEFMVLLAGIWVYRLAADFGTADFSNYALSRRIVSLVQPVVLLGMAVSLPRQLASVHDTALLESSRYFIASAIWPLILCGVFALSALMFPGWLAYIFLGSADMSFLMFPIVVMICGLVWQSLVYSYFRGKMLISSANLLQLITMGVVPVTAFFISANISMVLMVTGICWLLIPVLFLAPEWTAFIKHGMPEKIHMNELYVFGLQRVPGDIAYAMLFAAPPLLTAHYFGITQAGFVAFGITLLNMASAALNPISIILLPEARKMVVEMKFDLLLARSRKLILNVFFLSAAGVIVFEVFAGSILQMYLGSADPDLVLVTRLLVPGAIGLAVFVVLRSIIDAYYKKALNTLNVLMSFSVFLIFILFFLLFDAPFWLPLAGFSCAMFFLGGIAIYRIVRIKHIETRSK
ncbi:MAG TPA: hypothetical protein VFW78_07195 [Bacteroidia bacterium]|nr:hypothetical protein [Bacteroidia bacterium]